MPGVKKKKGQKRKAVNQDDDKEIVFNLKKKAKYDAEIKEPRRSPNGFILPDPLPEGLIVTDLRKKKWRLGKSIGLGGFGEIYSAAFLNGTRASREDFVVKVEPHTNGPLFVELHFYCRATKGEDIETFMASRKLNHLGVPNLKGHGSFTYQGKKLRFIVMPRYGTDLQTILDTSKSHLLTAESACSVALQVVNCFEYLHSMGYVHKDLKGSNLIFARGNSRKVFLVDYGLTSRLTHSGLHKPFEPDQRSAHEGTLEYVSRDSHLGCVSRRGDIEILLYCLIDWLGGKLPWDSEDQTFKPPQIQQMKIEAFHDVKGFLGKIFKAGHYPSFLEDLMNFVKNLRFEEAPDYNFLRSLFKPEHEVANVHFVDEEIQLNIKEDLSEDDAEITLTSPILRKMKKPSKRRSLPLNLKRQNSVSQPWSPGQMAGYSEQKNQIIRKMCEESLKNPTPAMTEQLARMQKRAKGSPSISVNTTRRKGLVAKRRLVHHQFTSDSGGEEESKNDQLEVVSKPVIKDNIGGVRKSPRKAVVDKKKGFFGQHLYGIVAPHLGVVSNLVKSMFQTQQVTLSQQNSESN